MVWTTDANMNMFQIVLFFLVFPFFFFLGEILLNQVHHGNICISVPPSSAPIPPHLDSDSEF